MRFNAFLHSVCALHEQAHPSGSSRKSLKIQIYLKELQAGVIYLGSVSLLWAS
jgi:hypothetical protein